MAKNTKEVIPSRNFSHEYYAKPYLLQKVPDFFYSFYIFYIFSIRVHWDLDPLGTSVRNSCYRINMHNDQLWRIVTCICETVVVQIAYVLWKTCTNILCCGAESFSVADVRVVCFYPSYLFPAIDVSKSYY